MSEHLPWARIDTVLLDMDGTLLDLHFDNHFWLEHVPLRYAQRLGVDLARARGMLFTRMKAVEGTLDWYCLDFWSRELELDIVGLKREVSHLIGFRPRAREFLEALRAGGKHAVIVTNAHEGSLLLKLEHTALDEYVDQVLSSHEFGLPKEAPEFWERLRKRVPFDPARTLLLDDSARVLASARDYGIVHVRGIAQPDTKQPPREAGEFETVASFDELGSGLGQIEKCRSD